MMQYINHIMEVYACLLGLESALHIFRGQGWYSPNSH
jgi:hypothetical protein